MKKLLIVTIASVIFSGMFYVPAAGQGFYASRIVPQASLPANCDPRNGDVVFLTTGNVGLYACTSSNTWTRTNTDGTFNVKSFGATGNGVTNDTTAVQAAANAAMAVQGTLYFPAGTYLISQLDLRAITPVTNAGRFGLKVQGDGMGTRLLHTATVSPMINLEAGAGSDLQFLISDMQITTTTITQIAMEIGLCNRYSVLRNLRFYGFQSAIRFNRLTQGFSMYNIGIRGCGRQGVLSTATASNIETKWIDGYVDNCGVSQHPAGGNYYPALDLFQWGASDIIGVVMEGNYAGGIRLATCTKVRFRGCRSEETIADWVAGAANIHSVDATNTDSAFEDMYFAFNSTTGKQWGTVGSDVLFQHCNIEDSVAGGATIFNIVGTPDINAWNTTFTGCLGTQARWTGLTLLAFGAGLPALANGSVLYCPTCTIASPCAGGGNGALAKRLNGIWVCN